MIALEREPETKRREPQPTADAVAARVDRIYHDLNAMISRGDSRWLREAWADWGPRLLHLKQESDEQPDVAIALVGGTGAGKSTLLNALVNARLLPVNDHKACTAAVTEVAYAPGPGYTAEIEFIPRAKWQHEVELLRALIADARVALAEADGVGGPQLAPADRSGASESAADARATCVKLKAVYGLEDGVDPLDVDLDLLVEDPEITRAFADKTRFVQCHEIGEFRKNIDKYLRSGHCFWPIVQTVKIRGPFEALRLGVKLIDLPGINDPNEAREKVTKQYLKTCRFVWIVFNMKRSLTRDVMELMQSDDFLRQIVMDGRDNSLTLIGTHSDDVDLDAAHDDLDLEEDADDIEAIEAIEARNADVRKEVAQQLGEAAMRLVRLVGDDQARAVALATSFKASPIFTISAREYLRIKGLSRSKDPRIESVAQTEVPMVREHMDKISAEYGAEAHALALHYRLDMLLADIDSQVRLQRLRLDSQRRDNAAVMKEVEDAVAVASSFLNVGLQRDQEAFVQGLEANEKLLRERLRRGVERAQRDLFNVSARWQAMHWCTLRAVVRRRGSFRRSNGTQHDFVADLARPMLTTITLEWADFFGDNLHNALERGKQQLLLSSADYSQRLTEATAPLGESWPTVRQELQIIRQNTAKVLEERLNTAETGMRRRIENDQRELYESIPKQIKANMIQAFDLAAQESGRGMKDRMIDILNTHARKVADVMFDDAEQEIMEGVRSLDAWLAKQLGMMADDVKRHARLMAENLTHGATTLAPELIAQELAHVENVAAIVAGFNR